MADNFATGFVLALCLALIIWSAVLTHQDNQRAAFDEHVDDALAIANPASESVRAA